MKGPRRLVSKANSGFFYELGIQARLLWRLMQDSRVNAIYKLLPVGSAIYLLNPFDFFGPIDDAFVIWLGSSLFIELAPQDVVQEHRAKLEPVRKKVKMERDNISEQDIIDADFSE